MLTYNAISVISESITSIYPIILKLSTLDVPFNTFLRLSTLFILSAFFANYSVLETVGIPKLLTLSVVNIVHVLTSYYGFRALNPSLSSAIFYTYPFFNMIFSVLLFNEAIPLHKLLYIFPVSYFVYNIYRDNKEDKSKTFPQNLPVGIPMTFISALTETMMYIVLKSVNLGSNLWNPLFAIYSLSAIFYMIYYIATLKKDDINKIKEKSNEVFWLVIVNIFVGLIGQGLRFWSITRVSTLFYAISSYSGIFSTIILGHYLGIEKTDIKKILHFIGLILSLIMMQFI